MHRGPLAVVATLTLVVLSAGCLGIIDETPDAEELEAALEDPEGYDALEATIAVEDEIEDDAADREADLIATEDGSVSLEWREGEAVESVLVTDGENITAYEAERDAVTRYENADLFSVHPREESAYFRNLGSDEIDAEDPLRGTLDIMFEQYNATDVEPGSVDGIDTYEIRFEPVEQDLQGPAVQVGDTRYVLPADDDDGAQPTFEHVTVAVDQETLVPLSYHTSTSEGDITYTYEDVTTAPDVEPEQFTLDSTVTENATVETTELPRYTLIDEVDEARDAVDYPVEGPNLPSAYTERGGALAAFDNHTDVTLGYEHPEKPPLSVAISPAGFDFEGQTGERTTVDGVPATVYEQLQRTALVVHCVEVEYVLAGYYTPEELESIAATLECAPGDRDTEPGG